MYKLFIPQKISLQTESLVELKQTAIKTVEEIIHKTLSDWEHQ